MKESMGQRSLVVLLALTLPAGPGCLSFINPVEPATTSQAAPCKALPEYCRNRVYIFFIQGIDPLCCGNFRGLHDYVQSLGFIKTYYGYLHHISYFHKEICRLHKEDPDARFVLIGFNLGASSARDLANEVHGEGVTIDLLVYLGSHPLTNCPENRPEHVLRVINIQGSGWLVEGDSIDGAENIHLDDAWHLGAPGHLHTLHTLAEELTLVASRVPFIEHKVSMPWIEQAPAPTPLPSPHAGPRDEWDFLKPIEGLPQPRLLPDPKPVPRSPAPQTAPLRQKTDTPGANQP
jgi:hypothetical protein